MTCVAERYRNQSLTQLRAMNIKRCTKCRLVKSTTEFNQKANSPDGVDYRCRNCQQIESDRLTQRGLDVLMNLANSQDHCQDCQQPYSDEDWYYFEFDHIDVSLKKHRKETNARWVAGHTVEFLKRVAPNLQLLCVKCHKIKSREEKKVGGAVYLKTFGESKSKLIIQPDPTLFDQLTSN